ncbi:MAG: GPR1/FUN34/YaaH family transporter [Terracidiphilus sp.]
MVSNSKSIVTTTVGYSCIALSGWMISMSNAAWFPKFYETGQALMYALAIVLGVIAILTFLQSRTLDAVVFFGVAGLQLSTCYAEKSMAGAMAPQSYVGWFVIIWAVFFCYVWLGSLKSGILRMLYLLIFWLTLLALAIGDLGNLHSITLVGGYLGLITSILAAIIAAWEIIEHGCKGDLNGAAA